MSRHLKLCLNAGLQVWVGVVPSGPTGASLNSSYASRSTQRYRDDLGNALVNFARAVPDGLLVFFPAYSVMTSCLEHWKAPPGGGGGAGWGRRCHQAWGLTASPGAAG
jgi:regulator of telomere elongation helicase 1